MQLLKSGRPDPRPLFVGWVYLVLSCIWIIASDRWIRHLSIDPDVLTRLNIFKGLFFVLVSTVLVYVLVRRITRGKANLEKMVAARTDALGKSEERYRRVVETAQEGIWQIDAENKTVFVNSRMAELLQYLPEEMIGTYPLQYIDKELHEEARGLLNKLREGRWKAQPELRLRRRDGAEVWVRLNAFLIADERGQFAGAVAMASDITEQRQVESRIQLQAAALEAAANAIVITGTDGTIQWVNHAFTEMTGFTKEEAIGNNPRVLKSGIMEDAFYAELWKTIRSGKTWKGEITNRTKDGRFYTEEMTIAPVATPAGEINHYIAIKQDITSAHRAEDALRESEAQYRLLFDYNPLPMWVFDLKSLQFLAVNQAAVDHYGYSREEFFRMTVLDIRPNEDIPALLAQLAKPHSGLRTNRVWKHRKKNGTVIDVEVTGHLLNFHGLDAELVLAHDVTARRKSEEKLRQSQEKFEKAFGASPLGITITSEAEGRYIDVNPAFLKIMGYTREEMVGRTAEELKVWADPVNRNPLIKQLRNGEVAMPAEVRFRTRSGQMRMVQMSAERIRLDDEPCILAISQDVTDARDLEQQFRQAQKMEAVGRLAGGIAHDFNNMLGVIIGYSEIAKEKLDAQHAVQKYLAEIRTAGQRAAALTRQLLAFSRQQRLEPRTLNLNTVIQSLSKMLLPMIGEDVKLDFRPGEPLGNVRADQGQIEQILMNLAVNARDAMPDGGTIVIETANVVLDETYVLQHKPVQAGSYVMISVADSGVGMDEATKARVFEPFFTTKELGKGTGLGLSTVYGIVKQSGGYIWLYSELGRGTTFKVYLPFVDQKAEQLQKVDDGAVPGGNETVLLVEDEEALRQLAESVLQEKGYTVLAARDAESALAMAREPDRKIDLLLTDVIMTGMTGPDLVAEIRQERPKLKVLYMSGYAGSTLPRQDILHKDATLLTKPFSTRALLTQVRTVLDGNTAPESSTASAANGKG